MDYPPELYDESFDIGEESFQPDYYELDDEYDNASIAASSVNSVASEECTTGRKISIKKPGVDQLPVLATTRRKRRWKSSSRNDTAASVSSTSSTFEASVAMSSSGNTAAEPTVIQVDAQACDVSSLIADELLVGDGWVWMLTCH